MASPPSERRERSIPALGILLERPAIAAYVPVLSRPLVARILRDELASLRDALRAGGDFPGDGDLEGRLEGLLRAKARSRIHRVLNGSGVLLHTNLGRAPLGEAEWARAAAVALGYSNLEFDLARGERGGRGTLAAELAALAAGAESAIVLNNNAAAVLLALKAIAAGREVVVSRGEQVQIGGGFRVPDILALSGARFVEVGTTNVTGLSDYAGAVGPDTACVLLVHSSNFAIRGFASRPSVRDLAAALPPGLPILVDQGSGALGSEVSGERPLGSFLAEGASLVCCSGDKLLGGPQAGIAAGRAELVSRMARDPLARALRPGKTVLSLLEGRLVRALNGEASRAAAPGLDRIRDYASSLLALLPPGSAEPVASRGAWGGGSSPDESFPSLALALAAPPGLSVEELLARLRLGEPPLVALARDGRVLVDLAALLGDEPALVASCLSSALARGAT